MTLPRGRRQERADDPAPAPTLSSDLWLPWRVTPSPSIAGAERRESDRSSDLFDLQLLMKILANVFEHFIKLGSVNPFRLKIDADILNELLKV